MRRRVTNEKAIVGDLGAAKVIFRIVVDNRKIGLSIAMMFQDARHGF